MTATAVRRLIWPIAALLVAVLAAPPEIGAASLLIQQVQSDFDPDSNIAHPKQHSIETVLAEDLSDGTTVCVSYSHTRSRRPNGGRVSVLASIVRPGGPTQSTLVAQVDFGRMKVRNGGIAECLTTKTPLAAGDQVIFDFEFERRPTIREAFGESFGVAGSLRRVTE